MRVTPEEYKKLIAEGKKKRRPQSESSKVAAKSSQGYTDFFVKLCIEDGLPEPQKEFLFAENVGRKWVADLFFEFEGVKVAVEKEGGIWSEGRHTTGSGFLEDMQKYNCYAMLGIFLIRFSTEEIEAKPGKCIDTIKAALFQKKDLEKITQICKKPKKK